MNSLFPISSPSVIYRELAACAPILEKFGMALSPAETAALAEQQSAALRSSGRIDLSGGAPGRRLFPAYAGVIPTPSQPLPVPRTFPRMCGG